MAWKNTRKYKNRIPKSNMSIEQNSNTPALFKDSRSHQDSDDPACANALMHLRIVDLTVVRVVCRKPSCRRYCLR